MTNQDALTGRVLDGSCSAPSGMPIQHRVVVAGNSMPMGLGPEGPGKRGVGPPYPVLIERALREAGVTATFTVRARARRMQSSILRDFETDLLMHAPDLVILHVGSYEVFSGAVPELLRRAVYAELPGQSAAELWVRSKLGSAPRRMVRKVQIVHGRVLGRRAGRRSPERAGRELGLLLRALRELADDPVVIVMGPTPVGRRYVEAMPGINDRVAAMNERFRGVVEAHGGRASYLDLRAELGDRAWRSADDQHFNALGHAAVADLLVPRVISTLGSAK